MADANIPQGGRFPSAAELQTRLGGVLGDVSGLVHDRRTSQGRQAGRIFNDSINQLDYKTGIQPSGLFIDEVNFNPAGGGVEGQENSPTFALSEVPTSSTNYSRPRTVAAGYDPDTQTMTVVFRDGTFYNYYEVTRSEWESFHASYSKGSPWLNKGFIDGKQKVDGLFIQKPRGVATDISSINPAIREQLYRVARTAQIQQQPKPGRGTIHAPMFEHNTTKRVGSMEVQAKRRSAQGKNPASAGKQRKRTA